MTAHFRDVRLSQEWERFGRWGSPGAHQAPKWKLRPWAWGIERGASRCCAADIVKSNLYEVTWARPLRGVPFLLAYDTVHMAHFAARFGVSLTVKVDLCAGGTHLRA